MEAAVERISIELTNACGKGCSFCYNTSSAAGETRFSASEVVRFVEDCAAHGVKAVSLGGGEPLQFDGVFHVLEALQGRLFRSLTTNGLPLLDPGTLDRLVAARPDKVHVSVHFPERRAEVERVVRQVTELARRGVRSGVNLLVARPGLEAARAASLALAEAGIGPERVVYLPMRGKDTPTPREVAVVAGSRRFQSMSCLAACGRSPRFCSISWDRRAAWCSYTTSRRPLGELTHAALIDALDGLGLIPCGGTHAA